MANIAYFDRFFQRRLSLRRQIVSAGSVCVNFFPVLTDFFSADSACVGKLLAQAQPAQAIFQRRFSLRRQIFSAGSACVKKTKWRISAVVFEQKNFFSPVLKSPTHIGFIGVKKNGSKISHLGTFKQLFSYKNTKVVFEIEQIVKTKNT